MLRLKEVKQSAQVEMEYRKHRKRNDWGKTDIRSLGKHKRGVPRRAGEDPDMLHLSHESYRNMQQLHLMQQKLRDSAQVVHQHGGLQHGTGTTAFKGSIRDALGHAQESGNVEL